MYVADYGKDGDEHLDTSVTEWDTKHSGLHRKITAGIAYPIAIAVTSAGRLYVANDFGGKAGTVTVYSEKSLRPSRTITKGIKGPSAVAVDASGYTYVANPGSLCPSAGTVTEYPPKSNAPSLVVKGLCSPFQLAIDSSERLYAAGYGTLTEYAPHSATLARTLTLGGSWSVSSITLDPLGDLYVAARRNVGGGGPAATLIPGGLPIQSKAFQSRHARGFDHRLVGWMISHTRPPHQTILRAYLRSA